MKHFEKNKQAGVMLIEALVAMLILSFGILGLVSLQALATKNSIGAEDRTTAANLANEIITQMWLTGTATPSAGDVANWNTTIANSGLMGAVGTVVNSGGISTVTVSWVSPSNTFNASAGTVPHQYVTQLAK